MTVAQWATVLVLTPLAVYVLARLISAAYFKSKSDHERGQHNAKR